MFPVIEVLSDKVGIFEPLGTKAKFWYDDDKYLFKQGRAGTGENWAEVVCAEIARQIGLPHAEYVLAECTGVRGVSSRNFVPERGRLVLGNELIGSVSADETTLVQARRQYHTARRIGALLRQPSVNPPFGWVVPEPVDGAAGTMAGYLLLDALVGNQDRHEENWGLLSLDGRTYLAPTFDHASSLGRNEVDSVRLRKLRATEPQHGVEGYARRARSQIFDQHGSRIGTHAAFSDFSRSLMTSREFWITRLRQLNERTFRDILEKVPEDWISTPARDFAVALLEANRATLTE